MDKIISIINSVFAILIPQLKKEDSTEGIQESKEALVGVNEVSLFFCEKLKDGVQFSDATDFYNKITQDEVFKEKLTEAYENYQKIPAEIKDIDAGEGLELLNVQITYLPAFINCFKK